MKRGAERAAAAQDRAETESETASGEHGDGSVSIRIRQSTDERETTGTGGFYEIFAYATRCVWATQSIFNLPTKMQHGSSGLY